MADIISSIGTQSAINVNITAVSGSGPTYTVTLAAANSSTANGDTLNDEAATPNSYLITAGAGTTSLTVADLLGAGTAPVTGATQATTTRTYSTITLFEADLDDTDLYNASDDAIGECYNDSDFSETVSIDGGTTVGLDSVRLTVPSAERHDGTAGTGVHVIRGSTVAWGFPGGTTLVTGTIEWIEFSGGGLRQIIISGNSAADRFRFFRNNISHDQTNGGSAPQGLTTGASNHSIAILNNLFYDLECTGVNANDPQGIINNGNDGTNNSWTINNTVWGVRHTNAGGSGDARGIAGGNNSRMIERNNIAMDCTVAGSGTPTCFTTRTAVDADFNMSDDATADDSGGSNNLISQDNTTQFVSTVDGSEDFNLVSGSDAIDVGEDQGTTPTGVNISLNSLDRDALGILWSMGAMEVISAAGGGAGTCAFFILEEEM